MNSATVPGIDSTSKRPAFDDLILQIHSTPLGGANWHTLAAQIADLVHADSFSGVRITPNPEKALWVASRKLDPAALREYAADWALQDEWYLGARRRGRLRRGVVSVDDQLVERGAFASSSFGNDFVRGRCGLDRMMNLCIEDETAGRPAAALTFFRALGKEPFSPTDVDVLQRLAPHVVLAAKNTWDAERRRMREALRQDALDSLHIALFGIDMGGRLLLANREAKRMIRARQWVRVARGTVAAACNVEQARELGHALERVRGGVGARLLLMTSDGTRQAVATLAPITPVSELWSESRRAAALLWIAPTAGDSLAIDPFDGLFDLTPAESRLLRLMVDGCEVRQTAERLGLSHHTVRNQLKAIFRKTGRRTQAHLLSLAARISAVRSD